MVYPILVEQGGNTMENLQVKPIGTIHVTNQEMCIEIANEYRPALIGLEGFSHICALWWFSELDKEEYRNILDMPKPYKNSPDVMGIFATRSPIRPNPIALSCVHVTHIDYEQGKIYVDYIDANDGTPLLDIKAYTPSSDRIEHPQVPDWCAHWPMSYETSGDFNWEEEFNF